MSGTKRALRRYLRKNTQPKQTDGGEQMTTLSKAMIGAALGASVLAFSGAGASADVVCRDRVCWHTHEGYDFPHDSHVVVHSDDWRWGPKEHFVFKEHEGRGYWRGNHWVEW
jgi:hypothetical protein